MGADRAWYNDVRALVRRPEEFWPSLTHTPEERLNSIVRLLAYVTLGVSLHRRDTKYVPFGVLAIAVVSFAHLGAFGGRPGAGWAAGRASCGGQGRKSGGEVVCPAMGGIRRGSPQKPSQLACTLSTPNNPFANMLLSDLATNPGRPPACKYDQHKDLIRHNFNRGLVRNAYDIYEKENSQRQWMTMPVTTSAPDTIAFAQFCYGNAGRPTCKEDPSRCTGAFP